MIWILWILFIIVEAFTHKLIIGKGTDPTPDGKLTFKHLIVVSSRFIVFVGLSAVLKHPDTLAYWFWCIGAFSSHLLLFGPLFNLFRFGIRKLDYLGNGITDKMLAIVPFIFRIWSLLVITAGAIYTYYNIDLL